MDITLSLPAHVAAAFPDPQVLAEYLTAQAVASARSAEVESAAAEARALVEAASAVFDGVEPPDVPTLAQRQADIEDALAVLTALLLEV